MKKENGITLVALVITIIVLLILAGVSISLVFNGDGLFERANSAAYKYNEAKNEEVDYLTNSMEYMNTYYGRFTTTGD